MADTESSRKGFDALSTELQLAILEGLVDFKKVPIVYDEASRCFFFRIKPAAIAVSQQAASLYHESGLVHITFKGKKELSPGGVIPEIEESVVRSWTPDSELRNASNNSPEPFQVVTEARPLMPHVKIQATDAERGDRPYEVTTTIACAKAYFAVLAAHQLPMLPPVMEHEAEPADEEDSDVLQPSTFNIAIAMMGSRVHGQSTDSLKAIYERVCQAIKPLAHPPNSLRTPCLDGVGMACVAELGKAFKLDRRTVLEWFEQVADIVERRKHHIDSLMLCGYRKDLAEIGDGDCGHVLLAMQLQNVLRQWDTNSERWDDQLSESEKPKAEQLLACLRRLQVSIAYNMVSSQLFEEIFFNYTPPAPTSTAWCTANNGEDVDLLCPCHVEVTVPDFSLEPGDALCEDRDSRFMQIELRRTRILCHYLRGDLDHTPNFGETKRLLDELQKKASEEYGQECEALKESLRIVNAAYRKMNLKIAADRANNTPAEDNHARGLRNWELFPKLPLRAMLSHHRRYDISPISPGRTGLLQSDFTLRDAPRSAPRDAGTANAATTNV